MTDSELLKNKIKESGVKMYHIADVLNISRYGLLKKINNESEFKVSEVLTMAKLLQLTREEREYIFFWQ